MANLLDRVIVDKEERVVADESEGKDSLDRVGIEIHTRVSVPVKRFQDVAGVDSQEDRGKCYCDGQ